LEFELDGAKWQGGSLMVIWDYGLRLIYFWPPFCVPVFHGGKLILKVMKNDNGVKISGNYTLVTSVCGVVV